MAFSGGVDSAYLLYMACKYAEKVKAYYVKSAFQPQFELEDAERFAKELKADMAILRLDVLSDEKVRQNPPNRCYYCKKRIFTAIREHALNDGFQVLLDGTNASDDAGDRPGMVALQELSVLSPLRLCGLTKQEIRMLSKKAGLFTWDKPCRRRRGCSHGTNRPMLAWRRVFRQARQSTNGCSNGRRKRKVFSRLLDFVIFVFAHWANRRSCRFSHRNFLC